jgi:hypothetical protein
MKERNKIQRKPFIFITSLLVLALVLSGIARAQELTPTGADTPAGTLGAVGTAFTYQGQLKNASGPVTGNCDFQFGLWDASPTARRSPRR